MFLARLNGEGGKIFLTESAESVATNLARMDEGETLNLEYWHVKDGPTLTLNPVTLKSGPRSNAPAKEVVEIEAGGEDVGSVERVAP